MPNLAQLYALYAKKRPVSVFSFSLADFRIAFVLMLVDLNNHTGKSIDDAEERQFPVLVLLRNKVRCNIFDLSQ